MMIAGFICMCGSILFMYFFFTMPALSHSEEEDLRVKLSTMESIFHDKKELTHLEFSKIVDDGSLTENEITYLFDTVDKDKSGYINASELNAYITKHGRVDIEALHKKKNEYLEKKKNTEEIVRDLGGSLMKFKILVGYSQCMTYLPVVFDLPFPKGMLYLMTLLELTSLDIYVLFGEVSCHMQTSFQQKFVFHMLLFPVILLLIGAVMWLIHLRKKYCCRARFTEESMKTRLFTFVTLLAFGLYTGISTRIFRLFKCRKVQDKYFLTSDYSMECYVGEWWNYGGVAVLCMFVYVLGVPLVQFVLLCRNRHHLHEESALDHQSHRLVKKQFGSIYANYTEECYYFDLVDLFRRLILTGGLILVGEHSIVQSLLGILTCILWFGLVAIKFPYKSYWDNILSITLSLGLLLSLVCGFGLELYRSRRLLNDEENGYEQVLFDWLLIIMTCGCLVSGVTGLILTLPFCRSMLVKYLSKKENTRLIMQQWTQNQYILTKWLTEEDVQGVLQAAEDMLEEKAKVVIEKHREKKHKVKVYPLLAKRLNLVSLTHAKVASKKIKKEDSTTPANTTK